MIYRLVYPYKVVDERGNIYSIEIDDYYNNIVKILEVSREKVKYPVVPKLLPPLPRTTGMFARALEAEGFRDTVLENSRGEIVSAYRRLTDWLDLHIRVFPDGRIEGEIEPHRWSLAHLATVLFPVVLPCYYEVVEILERYRIPYETEYKGRRVRVVENIVFEIM